MNAKPSELLMRNFNEIFIELDAAKRAALLAECYVEDCLWIHPGGRTDFLEEHDGRVTRLYTFIDQGNPAH